MGYKVPVGLSNKHLHLSEEHIEILFGKGHKLTPTKDLVQPGPFATFRTGESFFANRGYSFSRRSSSLTSLSYSESDISGESFS